MMWMLASSLSATIRDSTSVIHEDRSVLELLTADYTFANERLAAHYCIPNVSGHTFRRVPLLLTTAFLLCLFALLVAWKGGAK